MPAEIVLARIDNRLIHGQVLEAWVPFVQADCIVVANDEVAGRTLQVRLMTAAVPSGIRVFIGRLSEVVDFLATLASGRILLLLADSADALRARELGIPLTELNLGNLHGGDGKRRVCSTVALSNRDIDNFHRLEAAGVRIAVRCIPSDEPCDWKELAGDEGVS